MSALDRVERNNAEEIMLPVNVEGLTDNEGLSTKQAIVLFGLLGLLVIDILLFKDSKAGSSVVFWILNITVYLLIAQLLVRKFVFDEDYKIAQVAQMDQYIRCAPALMWDVMAVDSETNVFQYSDGRVGVILGLEQATIVGREASYKNLHYDALSDFLRELNKSGVKWMHIDLMMNAKNDKRLSVLAETVNSCDIPAIKEKTTLHLGYMRSLEVRTLYEMEFYLVVANATMGAPKLLNIIDEALSCLDDAAYNSVVTLDRVAIEQLMAEMSVVDSFDADETMRQLAKKKQVIKQAFELKTVEFKNTLSDDMLEPLASNNANVKRTADATVIELDTVMRNKLIQGVNLLQKRGGVMHEGAVEESLIGSKAKIKSAKLLDNIADNDNDDIGFENDSSGFVIDANMGIADMDAFAAAEEEEAHKAMIALGEEEAWKKAKVAEVKARTAAGWKEEAARKAEEDRKEAERLQKQLEEANRKREEEKKRTVEVDDLIE